MKPRSDVQFLDINEGFDKNYETAKNARYSRFPLCDKSLDSVIGVVHLKDLVKTNSESDLKQIARKPLLIPENMMLSKLLQEFRSAKQHFAFVQDEYGTNIGIVTLEDVLEELVGNLQDEFDQEQPNVVGEGNKFTVDGEISLVDLNQRIGVTLESTESDTLSGLIVEKAGHKLQKGQKVELSEKVSVVILGMDGIRVDKAELSLS